MSNAKLTHHTEENQSAASKTSPGKPFVVPPKLKWWRVERLIANLDLSPHVKHLLLLVHLNTNARKHYAWASQTELARQMGYANTTRGAVNRHFAEAVKLHLIDVRLVRTGKGKKDQHNEYWLNIAQLRRMQPPKSEPELVSQ